MAFSPLSDWLEDQVSALWDAGVCNKAKKPKKKKNHKSAGSAFCNEADELFSEISRNKLISPRGGS